MFTTNQYNNAGFSMTFKNGWTVSVQFGKDNYCDNRFDDISKTRCPNAEIAAWDSSGDKHYYFDNDYVKGWVNADEVADFIVKIKGLEEKPNE